MRPRIGVLGFFLLIGSAVAFIPWGVAAFISQFHWQPRCPPPPEGGTAADYRIVDHVFPFYSECVADSGGDSYRIMSWGWSALMTLALVLILAAAAAGAGCIIFAIARLIRRHIIRPRPRSSR